MFKRICSWLRQDREKSMSQNQDELDPQQIPAHLAIIMDGNGRWATARGLPRGLGHRAGVESLRQVVKACSRLGIKVLTVFAFSTENWKRPQEEVDILMDLLVEYLRKEIDELHQNQVQVRTMGRLDDLPLMAQQEIERARNLTRDNGGLILNIALNYGGRMEITEAARRIGRLVRDNNLDPEQIDEELVDRTLFSSGLPDPDLLIRPSGEMRISNFLLWQIAYTELWFTPVLWPDFREEHLVAALREYQQRDRRYGGLKAAQKQKTVSGSGNGGEGFGEPRRKR